MSSSHDQPRSEEELKGFKRGEAKEMMGGGGRTGEKKEEPTRGSNLEEEPGEKKMIERRRRRRRSRKVENQLKKRDHPKELEERI